MSVVELPQREPPTKAAAVSRVRRGRSPRLWLWTAGSGVALVVLASLHIVAQHFVVHQKGGLRTYGEVLSYIGNPVIFVLEACFLVAVAIHAMLGIRSVLHDLDLSPAASRRLDRVLWTVGTLTVLYGMVLLVTLAIRS